MSSSQATSKLNSGAQIPLMGFGTFKLTGYDAVLSALDAALACGYRLIDTAQYYTNEADIGKALKQLLPKYKLERKDVFITSKMPPVLDASEVRPKVLQSLKDLQMDYLDLFLIHYPRPFNSEDANPTKNKKARKDTWLELEKLHAEGKLRSIGVSNYESKHLDEMKEYAKIQPSANQCEFHPHYCRRDLVDDIRKRGIFFQAFTSLGRNDPELINEPVLVELAKKHKTSVGGILLAWPVCQGIGVLPKSSSAERIKENYDALKVKLDKGDIEKVWGLHRNKIYTPGTPWLVD